MAATLIRLRWRLTLNALKRSPWTMLGAVLGALYGIGGLWVLAGGAVAMARLAPQSLPLVLGAAGAVLVLGWTLVPLLLTGVDALLDPRAIAAWTAPSRRLAVGLAAAGATGLPGLATAVVLLLAPLAWLLAGQPAAAVLALLLVPVALATCVLLSRVVVIGAGTGTSRRGRDVSGVIGIAAIMVIAVLPSLLSALGASGALPALGSLEGAARLLGLTPFGWALAAPGLLAQGHPAAAALTTAGALALPVVLLPVWERVVRRVMTRPVSSGGHARAYDDVERRGSAAASGGRGASGSGTRPGASAVLPWHRRLARLLPSPAAAVSARCLRYWRTDPRYLSQLLAAAVVPLVLVIIPVLAPTPGEPDSAARSAQLALGGAPAGVLVVPVAAALVMGWSLHDDLSYDSTALWAHVSAGIRGRDDRLGRAAAALLWQGPAVAALLLAAAAWSGRWDAAPAVAGTCLAVHGAALAWASVSSVMLPYETIAPGESPLHSRTSGTAVLLSLLQLAGFAAIGAAALPVLGALAIIVLKGAWWAGWPLLVLGLAWGAGLTWAGIALGGRELDRRGARVLQTIRSWPGHAAP